MENTWMTLLSRQAHSKKRPSGVMMKLRGWMPVGWYPTFVSVPSVALMAKMAIPSPFNRFDAYRNLPSGEMWMSALPEAWSESASML